MPIHWIGPGVHVGDDDKFCIVDRVRIPWSLKNLNL